MKNLKESVEVEKEKKEQTVMTQNTFMAVSNRVPTVGTHYKCYKISFCAGKAQLDGIETSTVNRVTFLGNNIYQLVTMNSIYIVLVS